MSAVWPQVITYLCYFYVNIILIYFIARLRPFGLMELYCKYQHYAKKEKKEKIKQKQNTKQKIERKKANKTRRQSKIGNQDSCFHHVFI